ncbi:MAG TPA: CoA transferase, partial [Paraburkholderia sp.]|nr:CoA transferase [Paraburkholderia sp.]
QQPHPHTESGTTPVLAPPWRFDGERMPVRHGPPQLGEGTQEVLQSMLGYSVEKLAELKNKGVI